MYLSASNTELLEKYFKTHQCNTVYNYKTKYKALCHENIVLIHDYFSLDFTSNETIAYKDIQVVKRLNSQLNINTNFKEYTLYFQNKKDVIFFEEGLKNKL